MLEIYKLVKKKIKDVIYIPKRAYFWNKKKLITHFSYHKCMTAYFNTVFGLIAETFDFYQKHHDCSWGNFYDDIRNITKTSIISVSDVIVDFGKLPPYIGSHFIRDPRDILVSAYRYYLWSDEPWLQEPMDQFLKQKLRIEELGLQKEAENKNYQQLLQSLDEIMGYKVELNRSRIVFDQMEKWDFLNPLILELKYEEIFGNEVRCFTRLLNHYGFPPRFIPYCLKIVRKYAFESRKSKGVTGKKKHAAFGKPRQWKDLLPREIVDIMKHDFGDLLIKLGYEKDYNW